MVHLLKEKFLGELSRPEKVSHKNMKFIFALFAIT